MSPLRLTHQKDRSIKGKNIGNRKKEGCRVRKELASKGRGTKIEGIKSTEKNPTSELLTGPVICSRRNLLPQEFDAIERTTKKLSGGTREERTGEKGQWRVDKMEE